MKRFTPQEDTFLKENYLQLSYNQLAQKLNREMGSVAGRLIRLGLKVPHEVIKKRMELSYKNLAESGKASRFKKGHTPINKGEKMSAETYEKVKHSMFKPGHTPATTKHFGQPYLYERTRKNGYVERIWWIQEGTNKRSAYLAYLCRENGIDLTGKKPRLKPGFDHSRPPTIDDILIVSNAENMLKNTVHRYPEELVKLIQMRGAISRQINKIKTNE